MNCGPLSSHEADSVEAVAALHRDHHAHSSRAQRLIERAIAVLGRPFAAFALVAAVGGWMALAFNNAGTDVANPVYGWLGLVATVCALLMAILILVTQRRADELAERRAQLTLQLAILSDKRSAKIIALLEELRRDHPGIANRLDPQSEAMARPIDPGKITEAIEHPRPSQ